jgi:hypothetical protein
MHPHVFTFLVAWASLGADPAVENRAALFAVPRRPAIPATHDCSWVANPIDAFVLAKLESQGLSPSRRADKLTLLRRVTFDLTGLLPTPAEQDAFLKDVAPDAYTRLVDRLLASARYGERWAQHWLDLVRYAETDGFKADDYRPNAFRYRDYVINAFNEDLPYDRFIRQQLAGDELEPGQPQALIATGFNRLWPDEYNSATLDQRRQETLDDMTDVTGSVFLGLTFGCARCHDHKFDPILQTDYYRLQAFFAPMQPRDDLPAVSSDKVAQYRKEYAAWETATEPIRREMDGIVRQKRLDLRKYALEKFRPEIQQAYLTPEGSRTPYQKQIARMAEQQMDRAAKDAPAKLAPELKKRYEELERRLRESAPKPPAPLPVAMAMTDLGKQAPPTRRLAGGDWRKPREELKPGFPDFLPPAVPDMSLPTAEKSTGRRAALARWLTSRDHPLTARVVVNRLWQHHFGRGIISTSNDFGVQGEPATHPALLDWLAVEFMESGWSLKAMHRLMVNSAAYCQTSNVDSSQAKSLALDPDDKFLWHARRRRLEGEAIRDTVLSLAGTLNARMFGPSARPQLPDGISSYAWKADPCPADQQRRSVYVFAKRNMRYPMFDAFDQPDMHNSCARRSQTTTAPQALLLLNSPDVRKAATAWSERLLERYPDGDRSLVAYAYRECWGRPPTEAEIDLGLGFLRWQLGLSEKSGSLLSAGSGMRAAAVVEFCHALLNTNEFLYVD